MFSAQGNPAVTAASTRTRRRQRPRSDDGIQPPRAKRQRSAKTAEVNGDSVLDAAAYEKDHPLGEEADFEAGGSLAGGDAILNLPVRGRKETDRPTYDSHSTLILDNGFYSATRVSSLPEPLQKSSASFRSVISPEHGNSLTLTQNYAYVWAYSSGSSSMNPADVSTFKIPEPSTKHIDPLPLGAFTSSSSSNDVGMVVVIPSTGKIAFWQTIANSAILGLIKQKCNTVHGSVPGMMSGEFATSLLNAEPSGFIITFSTGRVAHLTIMDSHGKPSLNIRFLDLANRATNGGIFGGLKSVLTGASWRRSIAAAKGGSSTQRGQREVIIATNLGMIELWDIHWTNGSNLKIRMDAMPEINRALKDSDLGPENIALSSVVLLDFAFKHTENTCVDADQGLSLWILFSITDQSADTSYYVIDLTFPENQPEAGQVFKVDYQSPEQDPVESGPKIHVPSPGHSAFIVFKNATVIVSLAPYETPANDDSLEFQDVIRFRERDNHVVIGSSLDDGNSDNHQACCVLVIKNYGLVHLSSLRLRQGENQRNELTTKLRLEQIVFFGSIKDNPIDFYHYKELASKTHLEEAALDISDEIVRSNTRYIPATTPSLEHQMTLRANALHTLATYIKTHQVELSYLSRWQLLWNAEKMASSKAIWVHYNGLKRRHPDKDLYLKNLIETMGEIFKTVKVHEDGLEDPIRDWFIYDTWQMEHIIPWVMNGIRVSYNKPQSVTADFIDKVWQAGEISLAALESAFSFRQKNAQLYGIDEASLSLKDPRCSELPEFWTSLDVNFDETENLLDTELNSCIQWMRQRPQNSAPEAEDTPAKCLEKNLLRQFKVFAQIYKERRQWCAVNEDRQIQNSGKSLEKLHHERRKLQLYKMAAIDHLEEAISLAESFHDMTALVELMIEVEHKIDQKFQGADRTKPGPRLDALNQWRARIDGYFAKYGEPWADAFFTQQISVNQPSVLLTTPEYKNDVTRFLRKRPGYGKLSWMNEVLGERSYEKAAKILTEIATERETNLWSKQVELALGKLSILAAKETQKGMKVDLTLFEDETELALIQTSLYNSIPNLNEAIDESARLQIANDQFAKDIVHSTPALRETLQRGLAKVVTQCPVRGDELADVLTLMDPVPAVEHEEGEGPEQPFSLALRALNLSETLKGDSRYRENLEKIVWRRCMIRDDWPDISATEDKTDQDIEARIRSTALFKTMVDYTNGLGLDPESNHLHRPGDILNSVAVPQRLAARLLPEQRAQLPADLAAENEQLRRCIEMGRLEHWFAWIVEHGVAEGE